MGLWNVTLRRKEEKNGKYVQASGKFGECLLLRLQRLQIILSLSGKLTTNKSALVT